MTPPRPPSMEALLSEPHARDLAARHGRERTKEALRLAAERFRAGRLPAGGEDPVAAHLADAARTLEGRVPAGPRPVRNATGVLLHTNLGRAPLAAAAIAAVERASGFCDLEYDLLLGTRGQRGEHVRSLILELFAKGREDLDALATTNNAAALLLALDTVANGRPVAVSRGELVAIGGDFRIPSILARSGATLLEVGTTNRTTRADYEDALERGAGAVLKVRPSNYRIVGFTGDVGLAELAALSRPRGIPLVYDAGAGAPRKFAEPGLGDEPVPLEALDEGADLVFSGDKVLGGPQAGLLLGRRDLVERAARNPLARALRPDKLVLAALAATLDLHLAGRSDEVPFFRMLAVPLEELGRRAAAVATKARAMGYEADVIETLAVAGGGSGTESTLPSRAVALRRKGLSEDELAVRLRSRAVPIIARVSQGRLVLDLRTLHPDEDDEVAGALGEILTSDP